MAEKSFAQQAIKIVFLCVCWYSLSATNNVLGKQILSVFPHPMTLSMVHLIALNCFLGPTLAVLDVAPTPHLSRRYYLRRMAPLALGKLLASISSHISIWKVPVSYAHTGEFMYMLCLVIIRTKSFNIGLLSQCYLYLITLWFYPLINPHHVQYLGVMTYTLTFVTIELVQLKPKEEITGTQVQV